MAALARPQLAEVLARSDLWVGNRLATAAAAGTPTGWPELDAVLPGGGWPGGALVDVLDDALGRTAVALLLPALARLTQAGHWCALLVPADAAWQPYAPGWHAAGVDLRRLMLIRAGPDDQPWACDQTLRAGSVRVLLAALPTASPVLLRRLQVAAAAGGGTGVVFRPQQAATEAAAAPLRLSCAASPDGLAVRVLKRRGTPLARVLSLPLARPGRQPDAPPASRPPESPHALAGAGLSATAARRTSPTAAA